MDIDQATIMPVVTIAAKAGKSGAEKRSAVFGAGAIMTIATAIEAPATID